uniref:Tetratricopeptide TPR_2 repeat protein n=1 Tax=Solibacter usitatus (strain Ellin6076) TaxID=234267 RepID=Q01V96_SOLUE
MAGIRDGRRTARTSDSPATGLRDAAVWLLMLGACLLAYLPALTGGLVWDDGMHVTRTDLQSLHGLWRIWFDLGATQQYYPLLHSAFWLEHRVWGDAVLGYHLTNIVLHAISAYLVVLIVRRLSLPGAWLAGFLFALHPVCVEAVAWISEQKSALSAVFYLAAALAYLHFDKARRTSHYCAALGLFLLSLMSKTVTATLPAAMLVVFWWQRGRLDWRRDVLPLIPWFAVGASAGLFTAWVESAPGLIGAQGPQYALSLAQRVLLAGRVPWFYAWKVVWPANLMFTYPHWEIDSGVLPQYLFPLATAAAAVALAILARKNRGPLAAFLFFGGTLFPALGFLNVYPFRYSYVADHFQYLATLGILIPAAAGLALMARRISPGRIAPVAMAALLLATLGAATRQQSAMYRDYETLFRETLARNPGSSFLHSNLGVILMASGREAEAASQFEAAVRLTPRSADYHVNLGLALAHLPGRMTDAMAEYQEALSIDPHLPAAHLNLGLALTSMPGRLQDAIAEYRRAIAEYQTAVRNEPNYWEAHFNLGLAYSQIPGREDDAIAEYRTALQMKPDSALAHFHLGNTLHKMGRLPDAVAEYQASADIDPGVPEVHYELAYALAQIPGRVPEAIAECEKMLQLKPGDEPGRQLMASLLAFRGGRGH